MIKLAVGIHVIKLDGAFEYLVFNPHKFIQVVLFLKVWLKFGRNLIKDCNLIFQSWSLGSDVKFRVLKFNFQFLGLSERHFHIKQTDLLVELKVLELLLFQILLNSFVDGSSINFQFGHLSVIWIPRVIDFVHVGSELLDGVDGGFALKVFLEFFW